MFLIQDDLHGEPFGEFETRQQAFSELRRLAAIPWNEEPNQAPCVGWLECGRNYELVEYEKIPGHYHRQISKTLVLDISAAGIRWLVEE